MSPGLGGILGGMLGGGLGNGMVDRPRPFQGTGNVGGGVMPGSGPGPVGGKVQPRTYASFRSVGGSKMRLPATVNTWLHNEDLDTSGGAGALAASLAGGQLGVELATADNFQCPRPVNYLGYQYGDEESTLADADGSITIGNKRAIELPLEVVNEHGWSQGWFPSPLRLASRETVSVTAKSTGGGAEQHTAIHFIDDPSIGAPWAIKPVGGGDTCIKVAQVTGTLVANTQSGFTDITGRTTAYVGGQRLIPNSPNIGVNLYAITPFNSAGYSGVVLRHPSGSRQLALMGSAGRVSGGVGATNTQSCRYDLTEIFGGGLYCTADQPINLGAFGVGATAQWALLEMELYGVGIDG